jgi:hypothetical protein
MPLAIFKSRMPKKSQIQKMSRDERVTMELKFAAEIGVNHKGNVPLGANFRSARTSSREIALFGVKKPTERDMQHNNSDVQPGSLFVGDYPSIAKLSHFAPDILEKQILAHVERMGERAFATVAAQVLPQLNVLGVLGKQSRQVKSIQTALAKRAFGDKAMAAMKARKNGGIKG